MSIYLYTGTPGSGKSLDCARQIYYDLKRTNRLVISNIAIRKDIFSESLDRLIYIPTQDLLREPPLKKNGKPDYETDRLSFGAGLIINKCLEYWKTHTAKNPKDAEGRIHLFLDEAQLIFNSRSWMQNSRMRWPEFFSMHRHLGVDVYLSTQVDTNLDRQIRELCEYNVIHRNIGNFGIGGKLLSLPFGGSLFLKGLHWYASGARGDMIRKDFFFYKRQYAEIYDTHAMIGIDKKDNPSIIQYTDNQGSDRVRRRPLWLPAAPDPAFDYPFEGLLVNYDY